jgi:hypothetical protein
MIVIVVTETANIAPRVLPPMTTTGDWIALFPSEVERSSVGVALVETAYVVLGKGSKRLVDSRTEVGVVWGVVIKGECSSAAVVTGTSVGMVWGVVMEGFSAPEDEGSGRSIIREVVGVVDVEVGVVTDRVADGSKSSHVIPISWVWSHWDRPHPDN